MIMKKLVFILAMLIVDVSYAVESSVVTDLKELHKMEREERPESMSQQERWAQLGAIREHARPIVMQEFAKLVDGDVTLLAFDLLNSAETLEFSLGVLRQQFQTYSADTQAVVLGKIFNSTPDSLRGVLIRSFMLDLPQEAFSEKEIQKWFVASINGGMPAGAFYFILTDESADTVSKTAEASMRRFTKRREDNDGNLFSLVSAAFLASRGDKAALKLLNTLLDKRDIDSLLDTAYVIPAAAMTGNEELIQKVRDIITTDKRTRWNGEDCMPRETSFAHIAACSCSLILDGFPSVGYWGAYDDETQKKVQDWQKNNPTHNAKLDPRMFFKATPFSRVITAMSQQLEGNLNSKKP